jgi:hypothetical protein
MTPTNPPSDRAGREANTYLSTALRCLDRTQRRLDKVYDLVGAKKFHGAMFAADCPEESWDAILRAIKDLKRRAKGRK